MISYLLFILHSLVNRNYLSHAIHLSQADIDKMHYQQHYEIDCKESVTIKNSVFENITSPNSGAAIACSCHLSDFSLISSIFIRCNTELDGGSIYITSSNNTLISKSCFSFCSSARSYQVLLINATKYISCNESAIYNCGIKNVQMNKIHNAEFSEMFTFNNGRQMISAMNSSFNQVKTGTAGLSFNYPYQGYYRYLNLIQNVGGFALERYGKATIDESLMYINCFHHFAPRIGTLHFYIFSKFLHLHFYNSTYDPFMITEETSVAMFEKCSFDVRNNELRVRTPAGTFSTRYLQLRDCEYNVIRHTPIPFKNNITYECFPGIYDAHLGFIKRMIYFFQVNPHVIGIILLAIFAIIVLIAYKKQDHYVPPTPAIFRDK